MLFWMRERKILEAVLGNMMFSNRELDIIKI